MEIQKYNDSPPVTKLVTEEGRGHVARQPQLKLVTKWIQRTCWPKKKRHMQRHKDEKQQQICEIKYLVRLNMEKKCCSPC